MDFLISDYGIYTKAMKKIVIRSMDCTKLPIMLCLLRIPATPGDAPSHPPSRSCITKQRLRLSFQIPQIPVRLDSAEVQAPVGPNAPFGPKGPSGPNTPFGPNTPLGPKGPLGPNYGSQIISHPET